LKGISKKKDLVYWREKILQSILGIGLIFGLLVFIPLTRMALLEGVWFIVVLNAAAYVSALAVFVNRKTRYGIRAGVTLFLTFAIGVYVIYFFGLLSGGPVCLFAFAVMAGLLLGLRAAVAALVFNALILFLFGWLAVNGQWAHGLPFFPTPMRGVVSWGTFMLMNIVTAIAASFLVRGMQKIANDEISASMKLRDEHDLLMLEIRERTKAVNALKESEKQYRLLAENVTDIIWIMNLDTLRYSYVSPSVMKARGFTPEEVMNQRLEDVLHSESLEYVSGILAGELERDGKDGVDPDRSRTLEIQQSLKDGSYRWAEVTTTFIRDDSGRPIEVLGVSRDIHDRKQSEAEKKTLGEKLQQAQKMEAIATLAGGIAHQFNNALSIAKGGLDILEMELPGGEIKKSLDPVNKTFDRMAKLTEQLLAYARGGKYRTRSVLMPKFVIDTLPLIEHTVNPTITLETDLPLEISPVKADAIQMQMVLSSILSNSSEAIQGKGRIVISCREVGSNGIPDDVLSPGGTSGRYVKLTIKDNGRGMDTRTRDRVFEPFFTTKFQGRGLGMAAVYGIIKNHDGWIDVESQPGEGTSVHVYLPAAGDKEGGVKPEDEEQPALLKGAGTVLLIEDDDMVLDVSQTLLRRLGYRVISACTGKEAVEKNRRHKGEVDLALLDIKLPDMKAIDIYTEMKSARPDLKVIVYSGFSQEGAARELIDAGADAFIQKPFSIQTLSKTLDAVRKK